jgi:hypothetical protein
MIKTLVLVFYIWVSYYLLMLEINADNELFVRCALAALILGNAIDNYAGRK